MEEKNERIFTLGQVLNITTGRVFTSMDDIVDILSYLSQEQLYTLGLTEVAPAARSYILGRYPQLAGVGKTERFHSREEGDAFLEQQSKVVGSEFALSPMQKEKPKVYTR
ncbi:MAG: hypothetical protein IJ193_06735 [Bacilli bacterium]|nr:hypothetical protein [Bacilli bacterium]